MLDDAYHSKDGVSPAYVSLDLFGY
jgi:hypothetical protein